MLLRIHSFDLLRKAPFIGPKGGLYEDPQHTRPWNPQKKVKPANCPRCKGVAHIISRQTTMGGGDVISSAPCRTCNPKGKIPLNADRAKKLGLPIPAPPKRRETAPPEREQPSKQPLKAKGPDPRQSTIFDAVARREERRPKKPKLVSPHWHSPNPARRGQQSLFRSYALQGETDFQGLDIAIENRKGSKRQWGEEPDEHTIMVHPYGYIRGVKGADGDELDVYVGPHRSSELVFVVNQRRIEDKRKFDEHKVMLGFRTLEEARAAYLKHYKPRELGKQLIGSIRVWTMDRFKKWVAKRGVKKRPLQKSGGPYIGPRGGKYADPQHKIPWKEDGAQERIAHVKPHPKLGLYPFELHVADAGNGRVQIAQHQGGAGPTMPKESLPHFVHDLEGRVRVPEHPTSKAINAVRAGSAELLGKGDDGIAFKVGEEVVKVSTTVPFQPFNRGHRSPSEAAAMLREQVVTGNALAQKGVPVLPSRFMKHGDKGFQIKPYVKIPEKLSAEQLGEVRVGIEKMHAAGYAMNDEIQAGVHDGKMVFFDTGKAAPATDASKKRDLERLQDLYRQHGVEMPGSGAGVRKTWDNAISMAMKGHGSEARLRKLFTKRMKYAEPGDELILEFELEDALAALQKKAAAS